MKTNLTETPGALPPRTATARLFRRAFTLCLMALALAALALGATPVRAEEQAKAIPFDQLGAEAQKQYAGDGIGITPTAGGARLRAIMQRIEGEATAEGLWLSSTADEDAGLVNRFRVRAVEMGRMGRMSPIGLTGVVQATKDAAVWLRPGLAEEYSVSSEGVRQDFVVAAAPAGAGSWKWRARGRRKRLMGPRSRSTPRGARWLTTACG